MRITCDVSNLCAPSICLKPCPLYGSVLGTEGAPDFSPLVHAGIQCMARLCSRGVSFRASELGCVTVCKAWASLGDSPNLSISISGGKVNNLDFSSSCE